MESDTVRCSLLAEEKELNAKVNIQGYILRILSRQMREVDRKKEFILLSRLSLNSSGAAPDFALGFWASGSGYFKNPNPAAEVQKITIRSSNTAI